jgi:hypothetical protein
LQVILSLLGRKRYRLQQDKDTKFESEKPVKIVNNCFYDEDHQASGEAIKTG